MGAGKDIAKDVVGAVPRCVHRQRLDACPVKIIVPYPDVARAALQLNAIIDTTRPQGIAVDVTIAGQAVARRGVAPAVRFKQQVVELTRGVTGDVVPADDMVALHHHPANQRRPQVDGFRPLRMVVAEIWAVLCPIVGGVARWPDLVALEHQPLRIRALGVDTAVQLHLQHRIGRSRLWTAPVGDVAALHHHIAEIANAHAVNPGIAHRHALEDDERSLDIDAVVLGIADIDGRAGGMGFIDLPA